MAGEVFLVGALAAAAAVYARNVKKINDICDKDAESSRRAEQTIKEAKELTDQFQRDHGSKK